MEINGTNGGGPGGISYYGIITLIIKWSVSARTQQCGHVEVNPLKNLRKSLLLLLGDLLIPHRTLNILKITQCGFGKISDDISHSTVSCIIILPENNRNQGGDKTDNKEQTDLKNASISLIVDNILR